MSFLVRADKAIGKLFHFISPENLALALSKNAMLPLAGSQPMDIKEKYLHYKNDSGDSVFYGVSMTRNLNWKPNNGKPWADIRMTFDGSKLSQKYKIKSYNDFWKSPDFAKNKRNPKDEFYAQAEEKVITDKKGIKDFMKYVLAIDVLESAREEFQKEKLADKIKDVPVNFVETFTSKGLKN